MTHVQKRQSRTEKETIHSGHFMVSHFEAEAQDDFDDLAVPVPDEEQSVQKVTTVATYTVPVSVKPFQPADKPDIKHHQQLSIEISLTKLFKCMTLAYRQKLTSPKWNRFKGIKLRWKDKIRLNNVIWRCWHMQFIKRQNTLVCQFASPLDVDTHVKPETTILEGKYWKRRAEAVKAEYKKWRMFHIMRLLGKGDTSGQDMISDMDIVESISQDGELAGTMLTDEDYLNFMSDTLFSTISSHQPFAFPDPREIARGANLADFIQPSLGPLQPNLDDFMDTLEPLHDLLSTPRLPPVPEETTIQSEDAMYRNEMSVDTYSSQGYITGQNQAAITMPINQINLHATTNNTQMIPMQEQSMKSKQMQMFDNGRMFPQQEVPNNVMSAQEIMNTYSPAYEPSASQPNSQTNIYADKSRMYVNPSKMNTTQDTYKYNTVIPPSQTAPETVSLLQQPVQNQKYTSNAQLRSGYREKPRQRLAHYSNQLSNSHSHYQYNQPVQQSFDNRQQVARQPPTLQYLQLNPAEQYKAKTPTSRAFKMPSPPLAPSGLQQGLSVASVGATRGTQEQFRSHSLPLGAQLNADWSVSAPVGPAPNPAVILPTASEPSGLKHTARTREPTTAGAIRMRSRSISSGAGPAAVAGPAGGVGQAAGEGASRPRPPLTSVNSEPALPQASVMLAQLLSKQHSQSLYRLGSTEDVAGVEPKSPVKRAQPSPIGSDVMSPHHSLSPPASPPSPGGGSPREARRTHMHAEQKRRYNIKNGFDTLQSLIPHLSANPAGKVSKAAMLQKGADYIKQLKAERNQIKEEMDSLRAQIECLNNSISNCHSLLPATGAPVGRARGSRLREMFARHVAARTALHWKYWLFSVVCAALVESFSSCVAHTSRGDLVRTTLLWAEQHCSLVEMRPAVLNSLRVLCTSTDILSSPERLPDEARAAVADQALKPEPA